MSTEDGDGERETRSNRNTRQIEISINLVGVKMVRTAEWGKSYATYHNQRSILLRISYLDDTSDPRSGF